MFKVVPLAIIGSSFIQLSQGLNKSSQQFSKELAVVYDNFNFESLPSSVSFTTQLQQQSSPERNLLMDLKFNKAEVEAAINEGIESHLKQNTQFDPKQVPTWTTLIIDEVLKNLDAPNKPFKYIVTCIIMQRNGAGLHTASTCYWDTKTDGSASVRWDNAQIHAIVTVFALHV